ncbi:ABC transporter ATP-binding protein [Amedibacterium intestinale]|jgi:ABC transporter, ATP-binding protein|uniref:ABC transporter ATP-binding protein n=1 Tax=Amedibacterium intestinale TaxID=2583452 RepID=UPI000E54EC7D|nr:ABC transporter ATP-binding protein [Amedibacterium intestinale]RHO28935.1 ABC transporter ATP-binding protein [Erysipelotrichaceae bacterium AM17-60]
MKMIEVEHLTKDYGNKKGIFDISFSLKKGEIVGFIGPNGAGKTTTIRHLMGFIKQQQGSAKIMGMDCFQEALEIQKHVGYLPGEISVMEHMNGYEFIQFIAEMKQIKDFQRAQELIEYLEFDPKVKIRKMSKGMKQKVGLVIAFMQDAPLILLDEPTSGLDPLMQQKFVELIQSEQKRGKTILMSSHIFEEIEQTCDRILMIKDGRIVADEDLNKMKLNRSKHYEITFANEEDAQQFAKRIPACKLVSCKVTFLWKGDVNVLLKELCAFDVKDINARYQTLEEVFIQYYGEDRK